ncbi:MAG: hypothetical protein B6D59_01915 [Campylobacteraceae bacterium 4484_4]|nr:MAG: hypothetical protein B6D59_01915 [Campylobacteraceae bacterium 4484_4]
MMEEIEDRVLLLGIFKKEADEKCIEVVHKLEATRLFSLKEGKKRLKNLRKLGFLEGEVLTLTGVEEAKKVEAEFRL